MKKTTNPRSHRGFFRLKSWLFAAIAALSLLLIVSCQERDGIGLDLIDSPLVFNSTDTVSLVAYTQADDSLYVSKADYHILGFLNDPLFGKTKASIYTEVLPAVFPPRFGGIPADSLVIDSVIISFNYFGYVGLKNNPLSIRVFELAEEIPIDSVFSNRALAIKNEIGVLNPTIEPFFPDSLTEPLQLRIKLDPGFGRYFITSLDSTYSNALLYRGFFKGFVISAEETDDQGSLLYIDLKNDVSAFKIFFRTAGATTNNEYSVALRNETGRKFSHFENFDHAFTSEQIRAQVINGETERGDSLLFLQGMSNYRVKVQLPYINDLVAQQQDNFAINSARLILPIDSLFNIPKEDRANNIILYRENPDRPGEIISLADQFLGLDYFGGRINEKNKEFSFNITRHLQMILENPSLNTPLYITIWGAQQNATRMVLHGPGRANPMRLEIKYTQPRNN